MSLLSQTLASGNNLLVVVLGSRLLGTEALGRLSILLSLYLLVLLVVRGRVSEPLLLEEQSPDAAGLSSRFALRLSALCSLALAAAGGLTDQGASWYLFLAFLPVLALQDHVRYVNFWRATPARAAASDAAAVLLLVGSLLAASVLTEGPIGLTVFVLCWCASTAVAAVPGGALAVVAHRSATAATWSRSTRSMGRGLAFENLAAQGAVQGAVLIVAAASLEGAGGMRLALAALGPVAVVSSAVRNAVLPQVARAQRSGQPVGPTLRRTSLALAALSFVWGACLLLLPGATAAAVLGPAWVQAQPLVVALTCERIFAALAVHPMLQLRLSRAAARIVRTRAVLFVLTIVAVLGGTSRAGADGAAWALAGVSLCAWLAFRLQVRS